MNIEDILLQEIWLKNFRGFRDARIKLKPLTVLLGPNSAGKSSFGHALAAMAHAHRVFVTGPQASLTPPADDSDKWPIDLGKTDDLRTAGEKGAVRIGLTTRGGSLELGFGNLEPDSPDLLMSYVDIPSGEVNSAIGITSRVTEATPPLATSGVVPLNITIDGNSAEVDFRRVKVNRVNIGQWMEGGKETSIIINGLIVNAVDHRAGTSRVLSGAARTDFKSLLDTLTYLRATRKRPSRGYKDDLGKQQPIGYSGEWTPSVLLRKGGDQVIYLEPPAIPNSIEEAQRNDSEWKEKQEPLRDALNYWLEKLGIASRVDIIAPSEANNVVEMRVAVDSESTHNITEIGFGVSQIIPVLVAGLLQPKDSLYIVDLPEAHLHPRPQGAVADFFCSLALSGRSALVETHSEMFFHQLRLRAAMDSRLMENIAVYFIDRPVNGICCKPRLVNLGYEGELQWPDGFLQEAWETESQISAVREAQRILRG